jgi:hypothetical protein
LIDGDSILQHYCIRRREFEGRTGPAETPISHLPISRSPIGRDRDFVGLNKFRSNGGSLPVWIARRFSRSYGRTSSALYHMLLSSTDQVA